MKRFFGKLQGDNIIFDEGEAVHIRQVLRLQVGDKVIGIADDCNNYYCTLVEISKSKAVAKIDKTEVCTANPNKNIVLFQAMPKRDYFETIITKSIELGVSRVVPFKSKFTVNHDFKRDRINTIVVTACKQCERSKLSRVDDVVEFDNMIEQIKTFDLVLFANEKETEQFNLSELKNFKNIALIVGCEGGFCEEEIEKIKTTKAKSISLGNRILRCDTASVTMLAITNVLSGN